MAIAHLRKAFKKRFISQVAICLRHASPPPKSETSFLRWRRDSCVFRCGFAELFPFLDSKLCNCTFRRFAIGYEPPVNLIKVDQPRIAFFESSREWVKGVKDTIVAKEKKQSLNVVSKKESSLSARSNKYFFRGNIQRGQTSFLEQTNLIATMPSRF